MRFLYLALFALMFALPVGAVAQQSKEDWWFAESDHFSVYSEGSRDDALQLAVKLERLDQALRLFRGMPAASGKDADVAKPIIFQLGTQADIGRLAGQSSVAGFFSARAGGSVAFVPLKSKKAAERSGSAGTREHYEFYDNNIDPQDVLFHEYTHYFMFQHAPAAYPSWYVEGFAELFGSLELTETGFRLGEAPEYRRATIAVFDVNQADLFDPPRDRRSAVVDYAHGWLATSYLSFEPSRKGQLATYLALLNKGKANKDAALEAFDDLEKLEKEINSYRKQRVRGMSASFPQQSQPRVEVRALSAAENAQMDLRVMLKAGVTKAQARRLVPDARSLVKAHPNSVPVLLAAAEAEFDAGNLTQADALAQQALSLDASTIEALLYRAGVAMEFAKKEPSYLPMARAHFVAANALEREHPVALSGYYLTYVLAKETPPEQALIALETAYRVAPFDPAIRKILAHLLLTEQRDRDALAVLGPIVNSPHANKPTRELRELIAKLEKGERQPLIDELAPKLEDDDKDDD